MHKFVRPRSGQVLGLTAILTVAGLACGSGLPAQAAPAAHTATATYPVTVRPTAGRAHTRQVLLITGARMIIRSHGSQRLIAGHAAAQGDPMISMRQGRSITEVPVAALPYLGRGLSLRCSSSARWRRPSLADGCRSGSATQGSGRPSPA